MQETIGQICGVIVMIGCIVSSQMPKRWQILLGYAIVNLFSSLNQLCVGAGLTSCFLCAVATVHCSINAYKAKKGLVNAIVGFVLIFVLLIMLNIGTNVLTDWRSKNL